MENRCERTLKKCPYNIEMDKLSFQKIFYLGYKIMKLVKENSREIKFTLVYLKNRKNTLLRNNKLSKSKE